MLCNELLASHLTTASLQPPAVSPSDVCHDVDVVDMPSNAKQVHHIITDPRIPIQHKTTN